MQSGLPAECNPQGGRPCCSNFGFCGITGEHCNCPTCTDHRKGIKVIKWKAKLVENWFSCKVPKFAVSMIDDTPVTKLPTILESNQAHRIQNICFQKLKFCLESM